MTTDLRVSQCFGVSTWFALTAVEDRKREQSECRDRSLGNENSPGLVTSCLVHKRIFNLVRIGEVPPTQIMRSRH